MQKCFGYKEHFNSGFGIVLATYEGIGNPMNFLFKQTLDKRTGRLIAAIRGTVGLYFGLVFADGDDVFDC